VGQAILSPAIPDSCSGPNLPIDTLPQLSYHRFEQISVD